MRRGILKKHKFMISFPFLFILLIIIGCNEENQPKKEFKFSEEIQEIVITGKGLKSELSTRKIKDAVEINLIKEALQNAKEYSKKQTMEGNLFDLVFVFKDGSKEIIKLWYYPSAETGNFYSDAMYTLNDQAIPDLIDFFESLK